MKNLLKQLVLVFVSGALMMSCNNAGSSTKDATADTSATAVSTATVNYPYTIDHPDYWEKGSTQNTLNALNALKAWENKDMDASMKYFADSVRVQFDGFDKKISNDSLRAMIAPPPGIDNTVKMQDWESVISKDKKDEYVTVWYRQYTKNAKGEQDSVDVINDLKMKDGKIIGLDEYRRKLH